MPDRTVIHHGLREEREWKTSSAGRVTAWIFGGFDAPVGARRPFLRFLIQDH